MKIQTYHTLLILFATLTLATNCTTNYKYKIGVSQCVGGRWRDKANIEMISAQHLYDTDVKVIIKDADNSNERQCQQIDSLVDEGVDLLVVSPNDYQALNGSLQRARNKNIPIVFYDRTTALNDYTAYIGGDNVEAGRKMAEYATMLCRDSIKTEGRRPIVLEMTGPLEISPAAQRHKGFSEAISRYSDIDYHHVPSKWSYDDCKRIMQEWLKEGKTVDVVFCHSDLAAIGAYEAAKKFHKERDIHFIGIDGLPGEGIDAVQKGQLSASYIYPTHGEEVIALALRILEGKTFERVNNMKSFVVTPQNVADISLSSNSLMKQNQYLATIQSKLETYLGFYHIQRSLLIVALLVILLLAVAVATTWRAVKVTRRANRRMRELNDEQTRFFTNASHQLRTPLTLIAGPINQLAEGKGDKQQLIDIIQRNVGQLQRLINDVLLFRRENRATVDDTTATTNEQLMTSRKSVQDCRHDILVNNNADELATVLIVDDNADMRAYLRTLLLDRYYVIEAADGQSGLKLAVESVPDIVVSDVMMPVMDGLTFCTRLKQHEATSHIPVLLLTARSSEQQYIEGLQTGADMYMTKPFSAELLLANIASLLANRQKLRQLFKTQNSSSELPTILALASGKSRAQHSTSISPDRRFLDAFLKAMDKHMSNTNLKIEVIGDEIGLSRVQLYRKVKALTGMTPIEILRETRLKRAIQLLKTTDKTVSEIANEVGFATPGYFSSCFKKQYDKYPTDVREEMKV
ncbi:substrate-binding domain-containing protein [uncultured Prevotella sp.]|uniref:hybrid sensor histidine kinase/response regulator transcription factor n=1 Tax=uncultured Prevotella sp. TaxID=159272 RepID=UPI0025F71834|nr:substrate-binding domain-containing protein [uncultured Prevotella sp.]